MSSHVPSLKKLRRSHSWPPLHIHVFKQHKEIDENPFSFFISPPEDSAGGIADDLSAGIEDGRSRRSLSPIHKPVSSLRSRPLSPKAVLTRWIEKMETRYVHKRRASDEELPEPSALVPLRASPPVPTLSPTVPLSPQMRGRATKQQSPNGSQKRQIRSHSGRPRIWRSPPSGIWTLAEEKEQDDSEPVKDRGDNDGKETQGKHGLGIMF